MPQVAFDEHGLSIGGRRIWIMGAAVESALLPRAQWPRALDLLRRSGFNTIRTSAPWHLHEPRRGAVSFKESLDIRAFVEACREHGLWVVLRLGPSVGGTFSGGGVPSWLAELDDVRPREPQDAFLQLVARWYSAVLGQLKGLDVSSRRDGRRGSEAAGGLLAVQIEHGWECGDATVGQRYLTELRRFVREAGVELPVMTANGLWVGAEETIDVWQGGEDLFSHVRQLRRAQPHAPAIVEIDRRATHRLVPLRSAARGRGAASPRREEAVPGEIVARVGRVMAAGGQAIVGHAASEMHRAAPAGAEAEARSSADAVVPELLDDVARRSAALDALTPLALFASNFGALLAMDGSGPAVVVDPDDSGAAAVRDGAAPRGRRGGSAARADGAPVVVSRSSGSGTIAFVMRSGRDPEAGDARAAKVMKSSRARASAARKQSVTLVTDDGMRIPVALGESAVAWFAIGLDLGGRARLDYSDLSPVAFVNQSLLVLFGVAGTRAVVSIGGAERRLDVPDAKADSKPAIVTHAGVTLVVCNEAQARGLLVDERSVTIGGAGFRASTIVSAKGVERVASPSLPAARRVAIGRWKRADAGAFVAGESARFASIDQPRSLATYAPRTGYGWYRLRLPPTRGACLLWFPGAAGVLQAHVDGRAIARVGDGDRQPLRVRGAGTASNRSLVMLAVDAGRAVAGLAPTVAAGLRGEAWQVAPAALRTRLVNTPTFDVFERRQFVPLSPSPAPERSVEASLTVARGTPVVIDPGIPFYGAVLVNRKLVDVFDRPFGASAGIVLGPGMPGWSSGRITVTLVPMRQAPATPSSTPRDPVRELERSLRAFRRVAVVSAPTRSTTAWAFARWEVPDSASHEWTESTGRSRGASRGGRSPRGASAWWMARVTAPGTCAIQLEGLTTGVVLVNGALMGRYDTSIDRRLTLPPGALERGADLVIFDERGAAPTRVAITSRPDARSS